MNDKDMISIPGRNSEGTRKLNVRKKIINEYKEEDRDAYPLNM